MLANILPGLRELRSPLAAGYLWLLVIWLMIEPHLPTKVEATGPLQSLYELGETVSVLGVGVALSFVAYLVGALSQGIFRSPLERTMRVLSRFSFLQLRRLRFYGPSSLGRYRDDQPGLDDVWTRLGGKISPRALIALDVYVVERVYALLDRLRRSQVDPSYEFMQLTERTRVLFEVVGDLDLVATRLLGEQRDVHSQFDRIRSEGEFRLAILPPLLALSVLLASKTTPLWLLAVLAIGFFYMDAVALRRQATDLLADLVRSGKVEAPTLEKIRLEATDLIEAGKNSPKGRVDWERVEEREPVDGRWEADPSPPQTDEPQPSHPASSSHPMAPEPSRSNELGEPEFTQDALTDADEGTQEGVVAEEESNAQQWAQGDVAVDTDGATKPVEPDSA